METLSTGSARFGFRFSPTPAESVPPPPANKTIFLVQNTCTRLNPVKAALQQRGYHVIFAESITAALRLWTKLATRVDLFLADISLGRDRSAEQLIKLLQAENPRLRVLFANDLEEAAAPMLTQLYPQQLVAVIDNCLA